MNDTNSVGVNSTPSVSTNTQPLNTTPATNTVSTPQTVTPVLENPLGNINNVAQGTMPASFSVATNTNQVVTPTSQTPVANTTPSQPTVNPTPVVESVNLGVPPTPVSAAPVQNPTPAVPAQAQTPNVTPQVQSQVAQNPSLPNVSNLIASTPVVTPTEPAQTANTEPAMPVLPSAPGVQTSANVQVNLSDNVKIDTTPKMEKTKKDKTKDYSDDDEENENVGSNKAPIVITAVFIVILVAVFVYYFVIMTPTRVFKKAIDSTFESITNVFTSIEKSQTKMYLDLGFALDTENEVFKEEISKGWQLPIDYIDDDYLRGIISFDTNSQNKNVRIQLQSNKLIESFKKIKYGSNGKYILSEDGKTYINEGIKKDIEDNRKPINVIKENGREENINKDNTYTQMLDFNFYNVNKKTYIGPINYINYNDLDDYIDKDGNPRRLNLDTPMQLNLLEQIFREVSTDDIGGDNENSLERKYLKPFADAIKENIENYTIDYDKVNAFLDFMNLTKDKIVSATGEQYLTRSIKLKTVGGTTALALVAEVEVDKDMMRDVYKDIMSDYKNNKEDKNILNNNKINMNKTLATLFNVSEADVKNYLMPYLEEREIFSDELKITLYMNLANTELISFEFMLNNKYCINISYLNGYYQIHLDITNNRDKNNNGDILFNLDATYDKNVGIVDGVGYIDSDKTYLAVDFEYERLVDEKGNRVGNNLQLDFYKDDSYKEKDVKDKHPYAKLKCDLSYYDNKRGNEEDIEKTNYNLEKEVENAITQDDLDDYYSEKSEKERVQMADIKPKFIDNFKSHMTFLIDHLLKNRINTLADEETKEVTKTEEKKETKVEEKVTEKEETKTSTEKDNKSSTIQEENKTTEKESETKITNEDSSEEETTNSDEKEQQ